MRTQPELIVWIYGLSVWPLVGRSDIFRVHYTPHWIPNILMRRPSKGMCEARKLFGTLKTQVLKVYCAMPVQYLLELAARRQLFYLCNEL